MQLSGQGAKFISSNSLFDRLVGDSKVREMLCEGKSEEQIKATWQEDLDEYRAMRGRYLLYNDYSE